MINSDLVLALNLGPEMLWETKLFLWVLINRRLYSTFEIWLQNHTTLQNIHIPLEFPGTFCPKFTLHFPGSFVRLWSFYIQFVFISESIDTNVNGKNYISTIQVELEYYDKLQGRKSQFRRQTFQAYNSLQPYEIFNLGVFFDLLFLLWKLMMNGSSYVSKDKDHKASLATKELSYYKIFWWAKCKWIRNHTDWISIIILMGGPPFFKWEKECSWQTRFSFFWIKYLENSLRDFFESEWTKICFSISHFIIILISLAFIVQVAKRENKWTWSSLL